MIDIQAKQKDIASYVGRLLRDSFGRGPQAAYVTLGETHAIIFLREFMSSIEEHLFEDKGAEAVHELRESMMKTIIPEVKRYVESTTGIELNELFYDWNMDRRSGVIIGLKPESYQNAGEASEPIEKDYPNKQKLEQVIGETSSRAERVPDDVSSVQVNNRTTLIVRTGILVPIEKRLIALGYDNVLKIAKRELEKELFMEEDLFTDLLGAEVEDIFIDWNFEKDKSTIIIVTAPVK